MARMRILTKDGVEDVELETLRARSTVGSYWSAVQRYLYTGNTDRIEGFKGVRIRRKRLLTDPDLIDRYARIGELDIEDIYEDVS